MNDEAAAHYVGIIDQMTLGLRLLNDTFGHCGVPNIAWQIDPFGHSREQAYIFSKMGYEAQFFARLDYRDKLKRQEELSMEMMWKTSDEEDKQIFTGTKSISIIIQDFSDFYSGVLYNDYASPAGLCWDWACFDDPLMDVDMVYGNNIEDKADILLQFAYEQSKYYQTNNVLLTMGEDFQYQAAHTWFMNLDKIINYINNRQNDFNVNIFYSTPGTQFYSSK